MKWTTFQSFRNEVIGRQIDYDGVYGTQCVDLLNKFWKEQTGRYVDCGGNNAKGIWENARTKNAGSEFELIEKGKPLKVGDVVVFSTQPYGHCGFVVSVKDNNTIIILDENHTGRNDACGEYLMSTSQLLGAFRYKGWHVVEKPVENPKPPMEKPVEKHGFAVGDIVRPTVLYDYNGTPLIQWDEAYRIVELFGDRAVLSARGAIWAAMNTKNIEKV